MGSLFGGDSGGDGGASAIAQANRDAAAQQAAAQQQIWQQQQQAQKDAQAASDAKAAADKADQDKALADAKAAADAQAKASAATGAQTFQPNQANMVAAAMQQNSSLPSLSDLQKLQMAAYNTGGFAGQGNQLAALSGANTVQLGGRRYT